MRYAAERGNPQGCLQISVFAPEVRQRQAGAGIEIKGATARKGFEIYFLGDLQK